MKKHEHIGDVNVLSEEYQFTGSVNKLMIKVGERVSNLEGGVQRDPNYIYKLELTRHYYRPKVSEYPHYALFKHPNSDLREWKKCSKIGFIPLMNAYYVVFANGRDPDSIYSHDYLLRIQNEKDGQ